MAGDALGNLLRNFYGRYGTEDEGPPPNVDLSLLESRIEDLELDTSILQRALIDDVHARKFDQCRSLIEDLAGRLTGTSLLEELSAVEVSQTDFRRLASGIFWYALASALDRRDTEGMPVLPEVDLPLPLRIQAVVEGSLVMRLYVVLVFMREGLFRDILRAAVRKKSPTAGRVLKLLDCDYVRHVRNALSHGSFSPTLAGIHFRDEKSYVVGTPGFLNLLGSWVLVAQQQAMAAQVKHGT